MNSPETPAALLRRAADRLDNLDHAATPHPWRAVAYEFEAETASVDTLAGPVFLCPDDGIRCVADRKDADLIVALRNAAPFWAQILRGAAEEVNQIKGLPADGLASPERLLRAMERYAEREVPNEMAIARAVLGDPQCCPSCIVLAGDPPKVQPHDGHTCWRCGCEERAASPAAVLGETGGGEPR